MKRQELGRLAEKEVVRRLEREERGKDVIWLSSITPNAPFDVIVKDRHNGIFLLVEVKAFVAGRKHYWTQFKRPALKRKRAYREKYAPNAQVWTLCVLMSKKGEPINILKLIGLPSCDIYDGLQW